jgi:hypothetical protein
METKELQSPLKLTDLKVYCEIGTKLNPSVIAQLMNGIIRGDNFPQDSQTIRDFDIIVSLPQKVDLTKYQIAPDLEVYVDAHNNANFLRLPDLIDQAFIKRTLDKSEIKNLKELRLKVVEKRKE